MKKKQHPKTFKLSILFSDGSLILVDSNTFQKLVIIDSNIDKHIAWNNEHLIKENNKQGFLRKI